ncbi:TPA: cupin domain-containing protein [Mannheimia haemolytica]|uniref:ribosomal protein uL16 3-hydroxylase n=1 Tax=Mannheimia haemolytica TaxID=75985 RepID=UPI00094AD2B8|nr:cupin domain-containing protein [Mannheimia haemolytica]HDL3335990.1 cupin domain-containing protein [Mannheimia haemolytica]HDL3355247.1 cupin domain-containing protein [Mannheimia haemolytica]HDL3357506.1 cupin domain-containing protein [Mannheimia haemolytica]HDL3362471.1 cupin domain-containing protein [Mannheimia haemolytica]HDL3377457.1 cupin domain-containing protein [Mannheimia haemolytica]
MNIPFCLPENISPETFLREYWQKRPLLIRNGLPQIVGLFEPEDILELALEEEVTARLIQCENEKWSVKSSPLVEEDLEELPVQWSVMVQNLEQWSPELGELWQAFGFIPQWQRDDIMVSCSPLNGTVGKHYDEYDVFLVQGYGQRRWQLGKWCDPSTEFKPNQPIRIFDDMSELVMDEVMNPGDVLYVPSRMAHYGVSESEQGLTFSFGLRYPNATDLLENLCKTIEQQADNINSSEFHLPFRLTPNEQPNALLDPKMVKMFKHQLIDLLQNSEQFDELLTHSVATAASSRRYELLQTDNEYYPDEVQEILEAGGWLQQDANVKILYTENPQRVYVNGEWIDELNEAEMALLIRIANGDSISWNKLASKVQDQAELELMLDTICDWLDSGWIILSEAE